MTDPTPSPAGAPPPDRSASVSSRRSSPCGTSTARRSPSRTSGARRTSWSCSSPSRSRACARASSARSVTILRTSRATTCRWWASPATRWSRYGPGPTPRRTSSRCSATSGRTAGPRATTGLLGEDRVRDPRDVPRRRGRRHPVDPGQRSGRGPRLLGLPDRHGRAARDDRLGLTDFAPPRRVDPVVARPGEGPVAQLAEHRVYTAGVVGSIPAGPTPLSPAAGAWSDNPDPQRHEPTPRTVTIPRLLRARHVVASVREGSNVMRSAPRSPLGSGRTTPASPSAHVPTSPCSWTRSPRPDEHAWSRCGASRPWRTS